MAVTFIPNAGFTFERDGDTYEVTRVNDSAVFFTRTTPGKGRLKSVEGIGYWNSKQQIARMATLSELGHK